MKAVITMTNQDFYDINDVTVTYVIPELGIKRKIGPFDLNSKDRLTRTTSLNIPVGTLSGVYDVRVTISSMDAGTEVRRIRHRELVISDDK